MPAPWTTEWRHGDVNGDARVCRQAVAAAAAHIHILYKI